MSSSSSLNSFSSNAAAAKPPVKRIALGIFACLQNAFVGGIVFGWASIDRALLAAAPELGGAFLTAEQTTLLFTYGSSTACLSPLILGPTLDAFGPRVCLVIAHLLVVLGCFGFALSHHLWQFTLSVVLLAFGGPGVGLAIIHNANLFPQNQFLAVSILSGSITLSFSMFAMLNFIWEHWQVGFRTLFAGYGMIVFVILGLTLLVSPDEPYEKDDDEDDDDDDGIVDSQRPPDFRHATAEEDYIEATLHTYAHHHKNSLFLMDQSLNSHLRREDMDESESENWDMDASDRSNLVVNKEPKDNEQPHHHHHHHHNRHHLNKHESFYQSKQALKSGNESALKWMSLKDQPFLVQLKSTTFARGVIIFVTTSFLTNFTIASLNTEMEDLAKFTWEQQHNLSQQFTWCLSLGMFYSVPVGWLLDKAGLEFCCLLCLILGQISTMLVVVPSLVSLPSETIAYATMIIGFALYSLFRQFLYPVFLAIISSRLGFKYFGILSGIGFALSGVVQCFMADLVWVVHSVTDHTNSNGWILFHIFQTVLLGCLMIIPIADHRDQQRRAAEMEEALHYDLKKSPASTSTAALTPLAEERTALFESPEKDAEYGAITKTLTA